VRVRRVRQRGRVASPLTQCLPRDFI
jgi:hypothetical protein